jgi:prepilin peptidase dependent protein B
MLTVGRGVIGRYQTRGLSIVELLIGVAIGLFILAGAALVVTGQLTDNRRLMLETQVQQDLRAAADIISRDLRRASYSGAARNAVWPSSAGAVVANQHAAVTTVDGGNGITEITYSYSLDETKRATLDNAVVDNDERSGFRYNAANQTIDIFLGESGWQALTDAAVVAITRFDIAVATRSIDLPCAKACAVGDPNCPRRQLVRDVSFTIVGRAVHDANVQRSIRGDTRLRNDGLTGSCPA